MASLRTSSTGWRSPCWQRPSVARRSRAVPDHDQPDRGRRLSAEVAVDQGIHRLLHSRGRQAAGQGQQVQDPLEPGLGRADRQAQRRARRHPEGPGRHRHRHHRDLRRQDEHPGRRLRHAVRHQRPGAGRRAPSTRWRTSSRPSSKTFASYNQVYLTNSVVLDSYQVFSKPAVKGLADMKGLKIAGAGFNLRYLAPVGAVGVSGPLAGYYNQIQTGVIEACLLWPEAAATFKIAEVAPNMLKADIGCGQHQGAHGQRRHLGQAARRGEEGAAGRGHRVPRPAGQTRRRRRRGTASPHYKKAGGVGPRSAQGRAQASGRRTCPTWPRNGRPGSTRKARRAPTMLAYYMNAMRAAKQPIERQWDRE